MNIIIEDKATKHFGGLEDGSLFVLKGELMMKRKHHSLGEEYNTIRVGKPMAGSNVESNRKVSIVSTLVVNL